MSRRSKLGKQIVLTTGLVSVITTLIVFVGSFIFYDLMFALEPPPPGPPDSLLPQAPDYLIFAVVALCGLIVAVLIALRLARSLLAPLLPSCSSFLRRLLMWLSTVRSSASLPGRQASTSSLRLNTRLGDFIMWARMRNSVSVSASGVLPPLVWTLAW